MTPGEGTPYSGLYGGAPPEMGAFVALAAYERVIEIQTRLKEIAAKSK